MKIQYYGHSVVLLELNSKKLIIDPFITGNPLCNLPVESVAVDMILVTHGHSDHLGDTIQIAKQNDALVVAPFELANYLRWQGVRVHPMHIGGSHDFGYVTVKLTPAIHGSGIIHEETQTITYTGMPCGYLVTSEGKTVYHAGDTALTKEMKVIGKNNEIDVAFLPIGDNFTMGPTDAVIAAKWINSKFVIPMHYNTFEVIKQDPNLFIDSLPNENGIVLQNGQYIEL